MNQATWRTSRSQGILGRSRGRCADRKTQLESGKNRETAELAPVDREVVAVRTVNGSEKIFDCRYGVDLVPGPAASSSCNVPVDVNGPPTVCAQHFHLRQGSHGTP